MTIPNFDILQQSYAKQLAGKLADLGQAIERMEDGNNIQEASAQTKLLLHKLIGSSGSYGFHDISRAARKLEQTLLTALEQLGWLEYRNMRVCLECDFRLLEEAVKAVMVGKIGQPIHTDETGCTTKAVVLLVDDDKATHLIMKSKLEPTVHVQSVYNVEQAKEAWRTQAPDMVILDNDMGKGDDGLLWLETLHKSGITDRTPIIMLTASKAAPELMRALMNGAVDYLIKPVDAKEFADKVLLRLERCEQSILVVDDDESVRQLLSYRFKGAGFHVELAQDCLEAWNTLITTTIDVVVLDRMMPGADGLSLLSQIRLDKRFSCTPVLLLSAKKIEGEVMTGLNRGANDYVLKPFNPDEVLLRVKRLLESSK